MLIISDHIYDPEVNGLRHAQSQQISHRGLSYNFRDKQFNALDHSATEAVSSPSAYLRENALTLPMLGLLSHKAQGHKDF